MVDVRLMLKRENLRKSTHSRTKHSHTIHLACGPSCQMFTVRARLGSVKWLRFQKGDVKHSVWWGSLNTSDDYIIPHSKKKRYCRSEYSRKEAEGTCICRTRKPSNSRDGYHFPQKLYPVKNSPSYYSVAQVSRIRIH